MAREIVKLATVAAVILIAAVLIALFASGYISAFKPGGTKEAAGGHVVGGSNTIAGGVSVVSTPAPSPSPPPMAQMPEAIQQQQLPAQQNLPIQPVQQLQPVQPLQEPVNPAPALPAYMQGPAMPSMQLPLPSPTPPASWFDQRIIQDRPVMSPVVGPTARPLPPIEQPVSQGPSASESPFVLGWMQIIQRFVTILPYLFPGIIPVHTWWPQGL